MSTIVFVSKNGEISEAVGAQPRDALLFAALPKSSAQMLAEQRLASRQASQLIKARFAIATKRHAPV
ncbi:hypothetical protein EBB07_33965 [Paenibacillaceae bacterium]|nr:hypothetical protein EBB07_33965 [Paenibacillaceae bacterium]